MGVVIIPKENIKKLGPVLTREKLSDPGYFGIVVDGTHDKPALENVVRANVDNNTNSFMFGHEVDSGKTFVACVLIQVGVSPDAKTGERLGTRCEEILEEIKTSQPAPVEIAKPSDLTPDQCLHAIVVANPTITPASLYMTATTAYKKHWEEYLTKKTGKPLMMIGKSEYEALGVEFFKYQISDMEKFLAKETKMPTQTTQAVTQPSVTQPAAAPAAVNIIQAAVAAKAPTAVASQPAQTAQTQPPTAPAVPPTASTTAAATAKKGAVTLKAKTFVKVLSGEHKDFKGNINQMSADGSTCSLLINNEEVWFPLAEVHPARSSRSDAGAPKAAKAVKGNEAAAVIVYRIALKLNGQTIPSADEYPTKEAAEAEANKKVEALKAVLGPETKPVVTILEDKKYESAILGKDANGNPTKMVGNGDQLADVILQTVTNCSLGNILASGIVVVLSSPAHRKEFYTKIEAAYGDKAKAILALLGV